MFILFLVMGIAFFVLSALLVHLCQRLLESGS